MQESTLPIDAKSGPEDSPSFQRASWRELQFELPHST
jgi:hypothetical protein